MVFRSYKSKSILFDLNIHSYGVSICSKLEFKVFILAISSDVIFIIASISYSFRVRDFTFRNLSSINISFLHD